MHFIAFLCDYAQWQFSAISEVICLSMFSYIFLHTSYTSCSISFLETHLSRVGSRWYFCVSVQIDPISVLRPFPQRSLALSSVPMKKADVPMSQSQEYNSYHLIESYSFPIQHSFILFFTCFLIFFLLSGVTVCKRFCVEWTNAKEIWYNSYINSIKRYKH